MKWAFEQRLDLDFAIGTEEYEGDWRRGYRTPMWSFVLANTRRGRRARTGDTRGFASADMELAVTT